jgi:hypothetical protein
MYLTLDPAPDFWTAMRMLHLRMLIVFEDMFVSTKAIYRGRISRL